MHLLILQKYEYSRDILHCLLQKLRNKKSLKVENASKCNTMYEICVSSAHKTY